MKNNGLVGTCFIDIRYLETSGKAVRWEIHLYILGRYKNGC
jgi:hypothetical protein